MLVKLLPEQISSLWNTIKPGIERAMPPISGSHEGILKNILQGLLEDRLTLWAEYPNETKDFNILPDLITITTFMVDPGTYSTNLLIYCLVKFKNINREMLESGLATLKSYAKDKKCAFIVAYTIQDNIVDLAKSFGCNTNWTLISLEVE